MCAPNQEPAQELPSRAEPRVEAHHCLKGPDTRKNSGGRWTMKKRLYQFGNLRN